MLKVGDEVTIVDDGEIYPTYFSWLNDNYEYIDRCLDHYVFKRSPSEETVKNSVWTIIHIGEHNRYKNKHIAFIDNGNEAYMIGCEGVEEVETEVGTEVGTEKLLAEAIDIIKEHHKLSKKEDDFLEKIKNC